VPVRLATGAFLVNSGLSKLRADDDELHKGVHHMASTAYPQIENVDPKLFTKVLGASEVAVGSTLLAPFISPGVAGAGLAGFSSLLLGLYFRVPGMTKDGIRPSQQGTVLAKDSWMLAIGLALLLDRTSKKVREVLPGRS